MLRRKINMLIARPSNVSGQIPGIVHEARIRYLDQTTVFNVYPVGGKAFVCKICTIQIV